MANSYLACQVGYPYYIGDEVECSRVARKVVSSSPARGTHA